MPFKWKKIWPTTCALKATPFAAELEEIYGLRGRGQLGDHELLANKLG